MIFGEILGGKVKKDTLTKTALFFTIARIMNSGVIPTIRSLAHPKCQELPQKLEVYDSPVQPLFAKGNAIICHLLVSCSLPYAKERRAATICYPSGDIYLSSFRQSYSKI